MTATALGAEQSTWGPRHWALAVGLGAVACVLPFVLKSFVVFQLTLVLV